MLKGFFPALGNLLTLCVLLVLVPFITVVSIAVFAVVGALAVLSGMRSPTTLGRDDAGP